MKKRFLCKTSDFDTQDCKGFSLTEEKENQDIFVVKRNNEFFAYDNRCPHTGATLNWQPDVFMDYDNFYIQCSIHAARFEVESGYCVWGPCIKQSLKKRKIIITDSEIFLSESID